MTDDHLSQATLKPRLRLTWLDASRGLALLAMASYHFMWDLQSFGYLPEGFAVTGWPRLYARAIAATFLFLVGVSLVIGHGDTIRWSAFLRRLAFLVAAACLVSLATWWVSPRTFIHFGILHSIAVCSVIGLAFLRLPAALSGLIAVAAIAAPHYLASETFNHPLLWWIGLSTEYRPSDDFVPVLPWIGPVLLGTALTRAIISRRPLLAGQAVSPMPGKPHLVLAFLGRHSLIFYLVHQPLLIACVAGFSQLYPAPTPDPVALYLRNCNAGCVRDQEKVFCQRFCDCTLDRLMSQNLFSPLKNQEISAKDDIRILRIGTECSEKAL